MAAAGPDQDQSVDDPFTMAADPAPAYATGAWTVTAGSVTNIADAFEHLSDKVNEPTFRNYDKIQILIISDGIHDATKLEKLEIENRSSK